MKKRLSFLLLLTAGASLLISSCNTFIGAGRDLQRAGQGLENTGYGKKF